MDVISSVRRTLSRAVAGLVVATFLASASAAAAVKLPAYNANIKDTSVSGLSSGGFFAMQLGVAYSSVFRGVGIVAGGTYDCAGQMNYTGCMYNATPSITQSIANMKSWSGNQNDSVSNIANQKIYIWTGLSDTTVGPNVTNQVYSLYVTSGGFVSSANVKYDKLSGAAHTFPTDFDSSGNNACGTAASPYISNCSFDGAGAILKQIYGTLNARNNGTLGGSLIQFDQTEFIASGKGMDTIGYLYVPANCANGTQCKVHVALHGCLQSQSQIGTKFVSNTGYNKWADTNNIIVLYPQTVVDNTSHATKASGSLANPNACWDWIGWYGTNFDQKAGVQMTAIKKMVDRLTSAFAALPAPTGLAINGVTDTSIALIWNSVGGAAGYNVYRNGTKVNGSAVATNTYTDGGLTPGTTYTYQVTAVDANRNESAKSGSVSATTTGTPPAVAAPTNLAVGINGTTATLSWTAASGVAGYNVYRSTTSGGPWTRANASLVATTSYSDAGLSANTKYYWVVRSQNSSGAESANSNQASATTGALYSETATDTVNNHYIAGRINVTQYNLLGAKYGYLTVITLYHCGSYWTDSPSCTPIS
ncbi:MAG: fibronectin type III domain-containing protein [Sulfurifustis sp.]